MAQAPQRTAAPARRQPEAAPGGDPMRGFVLVLTVLFAAAAAAIWWGVNHWGTTNSLWMVSSVGMTRLALVLAAMWLAWPTIRRPAMWLPPGLAAIALIAIGVCVVHPGLARVIIPLLGTLMALAGFIRFFRNA
jgi:hypothetical protein